MTCMFGSGFQVKLIRLVGIMLLLYVKEEHAAHISEVGAETVGTGIMGRMVSWGVWYTKSLRFWLCFSGYRDCRGPGFGVPVSLDELCPQAGLDQADPLEIVF